MEKTQIPRIEGHIHKSYHVMRYYVCACPPTIIIQSQPDFDPSSILAARESCEPQGWHQASREYLRAQLKAT